MSTTGSSALQRCGQDLRTFTFVQHGQNLAEQQTEEAFTGASQRPVVNVSGLDTAFPGQLGLNPFGFKPHPSG